MLDETASGAGWEISTKWYDPKILLAALIPIFETPAEVD